MNIYDVVMIISGLVIIGTIIVGIRNAWKSDTYDVIGLNDKKEDL